MGRSHECNYPPQVQHLPVCTAARLNTSKSSLEIDGEVQSLLKSALSIYDIQTELIDKLQPTHIVTQDQCDVCAVSFSEVKKAVNTLVSSQPQIISLQPNLLQEVWADIARVADALQVPSEPLLQQLKSRVEAIASITSTLNHRPKVVAIEWTEPLMGGGNWIPELIAIAGGEPIGGVAGKHSPYILWEDLIKVNPEIIVIMPCGFDLAHP